jgi:hypothetical protein
MTAARVRSSRVPDHALSIAFGTGAAFLIEYLSPVFGGLLVVLTFPLVFRTASRVSLR